MVRYNDTGYSTISISNAIVPIVGKNFSGSKDISFQYERVTDVVHEGSASASPGVIFGSVRAAYFVGSPGIIDSAYTAQVDVFHQRPALNF